MKRLVLALLLSLVPTVSMAADVQHFGDFADDDAEHDFTIFTFNTSTGALATITNVSDGTSALTVKHSDSGTTYTSMDTIDVDAGLTGHQLVTLNFGAETLAAGQYIVYVSDADATVGSLAVTNFPIFRFSVGQYATAEEVAEATTDVDVGDGTLAEVVDFIKANMIRLGVPYDYLNTDSMATENVRVDP
jgi:hypothetical protein